MFCLSPTLSTLSLNQRYYPTLSTRIQQEKRVLQSVATDKQQRGNKKRKREHRGQQPRRPRRRAADLPSSPYKRSVRKTVLTTHAGGMRLPRPVIDAGGNPQGLPTEQVIAVKALLRNNFRRWQPQPVSNALEQAGGTYPYQDRSPWQGSRGRGSIIVLVFYRRKASGLWSREDSRERFIFRERRGPCAGVPGFHLRRCLSLERRCFLPFPHVFIVETRDLLIHLHPRTLPELSLEFFPLVCSKPHSRQLSTRHAKSLAFLGRCYRNHHSDCSPYHPHHYPSSKT